MDKNYKAWAKANPTLAKKVKKGQAGFNAINNKPAKTKTQAEREEERKNKSAANKAGWKGNRNY